MCPVSEHKEAESTKGRARVVIKSKGVKVTLTKPSQDFNPFKTTPSSKILSPNFLEAIIQCLEKLTSCITFTQSLKMWHAISMDLNFVHCSRTWNKGVERQELYRVTLFFWGFFSQNIYFVYSMYVNFPGFAGTTVVESFFLKCFFFFFFFFLYS